jgi:hypothetical protein
MHTVLFKKLKFAIPVLKGDLATTSLPKLIAFNFFSLFDILIY